MKVFRQEFELKCPACSEHNPMLKHIAKTEDHKTIKTYVCGKCANDFKVLDEIKGLTIIRSYI